MNDMKDNRCNDCSAGDFEKAHLSCLPDIGEIQVNGLMVGTLLSVSESMYPFMSFVTLSLCSISYFIFSPR